MVLGAIVGCEIAFWVVLGAGLAARYLWRWRRLGWWLLAGVPLVDLALLILTVIDLRRGAHPAPEHGLAAIYLGFSVAFGPAMIRWADVRAAHRWDGGPPPAPKPASGTRERMWLEWRDFGIACAGALISSVLLLGAVALVVGHGDVTPLLGWLPKLAGVLLIWFVGWPGWETVRVLGSSKR